ncbi:hypothetical protein ACFQ1S_18445, partial [Kibdelosporangium lantanae]
ATSVPMIIPLAKSATSCVMRVTFGTVRWSMYLDTHRGAEFITSKLHSLRPTYRAVATLRMPADEVRNKLGDGLGEVVAVDAESCEIRSHTDTLEWLAFRLTMLGCEFSVQSPPELVAYLRDMGARVTRATTARPAGDAAPSC